MEFKDWPIQNISVPPMNCLQNIFFTISPLKCPPICPPDKICKITELAAKLFSTPVYFACVLLYSNLYVFAGMLKHMFMCLIYQPCRISHQWHLFLSHIERQPLLWVILGQNTGISPSLTNVVSFSLSDKSHIFPCVLQIPQVMFGPLQCSYSVNSVCARVMTVWSLIMKRQLPAN